MSTSAVKPAINIYGWILSIVKQLGLFSDEFQRIDRSLDEIKTEQKAQSAKLDTIISLLTPANPVAFRIDLTSLEK